MWRLSLHKRASKMARERESRNLHRSIPQNIAINPPRLQAWSPRSSRPCPHVPVRLVLPEPVVLELADVRAFNVGNAPVASLQINKESRMFTPTNFDVSAIPADSAVLGFKDF